MGLVAGGIAAALGASLGTAVAIGTGVGGAVVGLTTSLYSGYQQQQQARAQGKAQQAMASYNAQVAENAQTAANQSAKSELQAAEEQTSRQRRENKRLQATQLAMMGSSGTIGSGTNILLEEDQIAEMKLQELDIMHQGELAARQHKLQAMGHASEAAGSMFQGRQAMAGANARGKAAVQSGWINGVGSAAQSLSSMDYSSFKSASPSTRAASRATSNTASLAGRAAGIKWR